MQNHLETTQINELFSELHRILLLKKEKVKETMFEQVVALKYMEDDIIEKISASLTELHNQNKEIKLFIDDERTAPLDTILIRDYDAFIYFIQNFGLPDFISFDHDLGKEKSSYDCAKFLVIYCLENDKPLPKYKVHSQQSNSKEHIGRLLSNFEKRGQV